MDVVRTASDDQSMDDLPIEVFKEFQPASAEQNNLIEEDKDLTSQFSSFEILGPDNRQEERETKKAPWNAVCQIEAIGMKKKQYGTGWFIDPTTIVTAGHVLWNKEYADERNNKGDYIPRRIEIWPGRSGPEMPYGSIVVDSAGNDRKTLRIPSPWVSQGDGNFDFGVIRVNSPIGKRVGAFSLSSQIAEGNTVRVVGYPNPGPRKDKTMYFHEEKIEYDDVKHPPSLRKKRLYYKADTSKGQSGGPILYKDGDQFLAVGIHVYGNKREKFNWGVRINGDIKRFLQANT